MGTLKSRIFRCPTCVLCAVALASLLAGTSSGQSEAAGAKAEGMAHESSILMMSLKTDRASYKLGDKITVQVLLTNSSKSPVYLYAALDWGESAGLSLWVKDAVSGKNIPEEFIADALPPPPASKDAFIKLLPDHIYGVVLTSSLAELNVRKKGSYELVAEYHSPIPSKMSFGLPIWSQEHGAITSNRVTITVGE